MKIQPFISIRQCLQGPLGFVDVLFLHGCILISPPEGLDVQYSVVFLEIRFYIGEGIQSIHNIAEYDVMYRELFL